MLASGLAIDLDILDPNGELLSEIDFYSPTCGDDDVKQSIISVDETHHDLSISTEKGDRGRQCIKILPCTRVQTNSESKAPRDGSVCNKCCGEALPPMYIFDSSATIEKNFCVYIRESKSVVLKDIYQHYTELFGFSIQNSDIHLDHGDCFLYYTTHV